MPVYMIRAGEHGPVKIGYSENIESRIVKMQADNHERLRLMRALVGGEEVEAELHIKFAHHHLHGEWFSFSRRMLGDLGHGEFPPHVDEADEPGNLGAGLISVDISGRLHSNPLQNILDALGGDRYVAGVLKCGVPAISNWKARGIPKGRWVDLVSLAASSGVKLTIAEIEAASVAIKPAISPSGASI